MDHVYVLHHERGDDAKLIGVYRTAETAELAVSRLRRQPGFCDFPDGFTIDAYPLDKDHWIEGFVT